ncbi:MAG: 50S ribosomal protein L25 [candidate division NC10 bacterium]|nr:50S ribosomal protein L25 [candidate division NC10 bacterium]
MEKTMEFVELKAEEREGRGKGVARKLRRQGFIPAIFYGGKDGPIPLRVSGRDMGCLLQREGGGHFLVNLDIQAKAGTIRKAAILKEVQRDPIKGTLLHADFLEVSLEKKIRVKVLLHLEGEPIGVKAKGGLLEHILREVEIECLPTSIPDAVRVDVSGLDIGDFIHVKDIPEREGIRVVEDPEQVVVTIRVPPAEEEVAPVEAEEVEPGLGGRKEAREEG